MNFSYLKPALPSIFTLLCFVSFAVNCNGKTDTEDQIDPTIVKLDGQGELQGITLTSRKGRKYSAFLGVPFGKISQRFAVAEPADEWSGVKKVQKQPEPCFQFLVFYQQIVGVEDCLKLNVYSPSTKSGAKLPVMLWISPGGFNLGGANMFEAKYLMDEDVVIVVINYRMGALGFLNTGAVGGNMGMKDQVLSLQWVQKHIEKFGGDPNLVTIFGLSAGGASVNHMMLSPMAKGLFHRAISLSGSSLNPWTLQQNPKELATQLAKNADCLKETSEETIQCLREKDPSAIVRAQLKLVKYGYEFELISMKFVPSVEIAEGEGPKFLTDTPYNLMKRGEIVSKVPWISGYTENEGSLYIANLMTKPKSVAKFNKDWYEMAPNIFYYEDVTPISKIDSVSKKIRDFYFGDKDLNESTRRNLANIFSDRFFNNGIAKAIRLHAPHQPVYPYIMGYQGKHSIIQFAFEGVKNRDGVGHADELMYMFNQSYGSPEFDLKTEAGDFSEKYIKLIVSFAKTGKPTETWGPTKEWPAVKIENENKPEDTILKYYELSMEPRIIDDPVQDRQKFWSALPLREDENLNLVDNKEEL